MSNNLLYMKNKTFSLAQEQRKPIAVMLEPSTK